MSASATQGGHTELGPCSWDYNYIDYNSINICKQISTSPQPYQKIPDIYFSCSCSLPNSIKVLSPITIQFVVDVLFYLFIMVALCNRADHYIFALSFLSSIFFFFFFFFYSSPNLSGRRLDVYHTSTHGMALVRI